MDPTPDSARTAPTAPADAPLSAPMRRALELGWESFAAGSFGIGAVATTGRFDQVAEGRNRILEPHPGDDVLAGSSVAHAEMNVLAKLRTGTTRTTTSSCSRRSNRACSAWERSGSARCAGSTCSHPIRCSAGSSESST